MLLQNKTFIHISKKKKAINYIPKLLKMPVFPHQLEENIYLQIKIFHHIELKWIRIKPVKQCLLHKCNIKVNADLLLMVSEAYLFSAQQGRLMCPFVQPRHPMQCPDEQNLLHQQYLIECC